MDALQVLKQGTRDAHLRVERVVPLVRPGLTLPVYRAYLARLLGFYEPLEERLAGQRWAAVGLDFELRRKRALLVADLGRLGLDAAAIAALPRCLDLPSLPGLPEALGCVYVLEGATRGGLVLARLLAGSLDITPARGGAFFTAYGDQSDLLWRSFCATLAASLGDERDSSRALAAALQTFERLQGWIEAGPTAGQASDVG